jgi:hypothetical protein
MILFYLGYIQIPGYTIPDINLFYINGNPITLFNLLIFLIFLSLIGLLPSPLRQIIFVGVIIWTLSILGILVISGLSMIIVAAVIIGVVAYLLGLF